MEDEITLGVNPKEDKRRMRVPSEYTITSLGLNVAIGISKEHAIYTPLTHELTDTSKNGISVNGEKLEKGQPRQLKDGDLVSFCRLKMKFEEVQPIQED